MSAPLTVHRPFAEQHALNRQAVARLWANPRHAGALEIIETDRDGNPIMSPPPEAVADRREICVEVRSPDHSPSDIDSKRAAYFGVGVREVWICERDGAMSFYGPQGRLERSGICPEFPRQIAASS